jgi:hypothetical protein
MCLFGFFGGTAFHTVEKKIGQHVEPVKIIGTAYTLPAVLAVIHDF